MNSHLIQEVYIYAQSIEQIYILNAISLFIVAIVAYYIGKRRGKSNILIPKSLRNQVELYKGQRNQSEIKKMQLAKSIKSISNIRTILAVILISAVSGVYYYQIIDLLYCEIQMLVSLTVCVLLQLVIFYKQYKFKRVSALLEMTSKEINQIGNTLSADLGEQLMSILKSQVFQKEINEMKQKQNTLQDQIRKEIELENKVKIEQLKNKIKDLEDKELKQKYQMIDFKRSTQQHHSFPDSKQATDLARKIQGLKKERQILKDFISDIVKFEWCEKCAQSEEFCLQEYFKFSSNIGQKYKEGMELLKRWKAETKIIKQQPQ